MSGVPLRRRAAISRTTVAHLAATGRFRARPRATVGKARPAGGRFRVGLLLQAVDVAGPLRWRWLLTDEQTGAPLADHQVSLDPATEEVTAFADLYEYVTP